MYKTRVNPPGECNPQLQAHDENHFRASVLYDFLYAQIGT